MPPVQSGVCFGGAFYSEDSSALYWSVQAHVVLRTTSDLQLVSTLGEGALMENVNRMCCFVLIVVLGMGISDLIRQSARNLLALSHHTVPRVAFRWQKNLCKNKCFFMFQLK